jgi:zinc transport system ATP-binding protein
MEIIKVDGLCFNYGEELILHNVSFSVSRGDFAAIVGANGAGKSTLLKVMLGELNPVSGSVKLFGEDARQFKDWIRVGYAPQNAFSRMANFPATAEEVVGANLYSQIGMFRFPTNAHKEKIKHALEQTGMLPYAKRLVGSLSGGQQQRVLISRVLAGNPDVMLLDEPTTGVDSKASTEVYEILLRLNRENGLTIAMVTHDTAKAFEYVSRIMCLEQGSIVELEKGQVGRELEHRHKHPPVG